MEEIRVKIRKHGNPSGKLLRFHKSIELTPLIIKIANKLLKNEVRSDFDASRHQLLLGGEFVVDSVSEIDDGDELVLSQIDDTVETDTPLSGANSSPSHRVSPAAANVTPVVKKEEESDEMPIKVEPYEAGELISVADDDDDVKPDINTSKSNQSTGPTERSAGVKRKVAPAAASAPGSASLKREDEEFPRVVRRPKKAPVIITIDDESDTDDDGDEDVSSDGSIEDGSDAWMSSDGEDDDDEEEDGKEDSDFEPGSDDDSDDDAEMKASRAKEPKESPLQVLMDEKDIPSAPGKREGSNEGDQEEEVSLLIDGAGRKNTDKAVKDRIMKLLNTGFHDQSNEHEAKNAMKLANKLMRKHNLSQALLLKERDAKNSGTQANDGVLRGGMVHVKIINRKTQKAALFARWLGTLTSHVATNFDVKTYYSTSRGRKCKVTFYGIYTNAQLAGYAFRVAAERISQMGATYQPTKRSGISLASCRLSYCIGIVKGIGEEVDRTIHEEKMKRLRKLERARRAVSQGEAYEESDEEGSDGNDSDGPGYSFPDRKDGESKKPSATAASINGSSRQHGGDDNSTSDQAPLLGMNGESRLTVPPVLSGETLDKRLRELENENQAAITLVDHRKKVAEEILKENGIKLSSSRPRAQMNFDHNSYRQGIEDAKEVDINQRAIRDEVKVKREMKRE
ncbi:unnamed protein product [Cylindrotheca closterium]|uniref:DUF2786 domain-containing protein n=1 Tax=Cylindrotheca closterium TaxID=2856 RepID=A0AAD2FH57_9STRA|nr:unnamed protein product [Cylindrotheca closterium]